MQIHNYEYIRKYMHTSLSSSISLRSFIRSAGLSLFDCDYKSTSVFAMPSSRNPADFLKTIKVATKRFATDLWNFLCSFKYQGNLYSGQLLNTNLITALFHNTVLLLAAVYIICDFIIFHSNSGFSRSIWGAPNSLYALTFKVFVELNRRLVRRHCLQIICICLINDSYFINFI